MFSKGFGFAFGSQNETMEACLKKRIWMQIPSWSAAAFSQKMIKLTQYKLFR